MNRLASVARHGGILLTGVGLAAGCMQIASAKTQEEKNGIFVETLSSSLVGAAAGFGIGFFLASNPVGWGVSLILAVGATATSYGAGKGFRLLYDNSGHSIDFVGATAMALLMPKKVIQRYFCEPYFSYSEQIMFTASPFSAWRVLGIAWLIAFPRFGRKRRITDIQEHCPTWYVRLSQVFFYWNFGHSGAFVLLLIGLLIYGWLTL